MMPVQSGKSSYVNPYNGSLGSHETNMLQAGISLFECSNVTGTYSNYTVYGLWDAKVREQVASNMQIVHDVRWYRGQSAYVEFKYDRKARAFAYIPDDELWHNRIMLSTMMGAAAIFKILRFHTPDGFIDGARVLKELAYLRDLTHDHIVKRDEEILFRSKDRDECVQYMEDHKGLIAQIAFAKTEPIQELINEYRTYWWYQPEWKNKVLPEIQAEVLDRFGNQQAEARKDEILRLFPQLEKLLELPQVTELLKSTPTEVAAQAAETHKQPDTTQSEEVTPEQSEEADPEVSTAGKTLTDLSLKDLRRIAVETYQIKNVSKKSKDVLIDEIKEKSGIVDQVEQASDSNEIDFASE